MSMIYSFQLTVVICGGCFPVNRCVYKKYVQQETYNMDFLSDAPSEALICSQQSQNGGASQ
jgi:hypothetical protein